MRFIESFFSIYSDGKVYAAEGVCSILTPITPEQFGQHCTKFVDGFIVTFELLILSSLLALLLAVPLALARTGGFRILNGVAYSYIYVFRGTPLLIQLWIIYFGIGSLGEERLGVLWPFFLDAWSVGLLTLTLNSTAYVAEILRGGIQNVPPGQIEGAKALGMSYWQRSRFVVLPQAFRIAWPAYGNEVILLMKASALVSTITVLDLMGATRTIFSRSYSLEIFLYAAVLYLIITMTISGFFHFFERRVLKIS